MTDTKKILIAEDSSVIQNLTRKILSLQNYDIHSVKNGKEVLAAMEKDNFDLILMDIAMPKMDGIECTRQIRAMEDQSKADIPIIAITGNARNFTPEEFQKVGINEYVPKPIDFDHLVGMVNNYLRS